MTPIEQQAREWANDMEVDVNVIAVMKDDFIRSVKIVAFESYLAGYAARGEWVPVTERVPESNNDIPPIYELYTDFPGNKDFKPCEPIVLNHKMGGIYWEYKVSDCQGERSYTEDFFIKYPHLFRPVLPSPPNQ